MTAPSLRSNEFLNLHQASFLDLQQANLGAFRYFPLQQSLIKHTLRNITTTVAACQSCTACGRIPAQPLEIAGDLTCHTIAYTHPCLGL